MKTLSKAHAKNRCDNWGNVGGNGYIFRSIDVNCYGLFYGQSKVWEFTEQRDKKIIDHDFSGLKNYDDTTNYFAYILAKATCDPETMSKKVKWSFSIEILGLSSDGIKPASHIISHPVLGEFSSPNEGRMNNYWHPELRLSFIDNLRLAILSPYQISDQKELRYKLYVLDLVGMRIINTVDNLSFAYPYQMYVNNKYITIESLEGEQHYYLSVFDRETVKQVNLIDLKGHQNAELTIDNSEKALVYCGYQSKSYYSVLDLKSGKIEFSITKEQYDLLIPLIVKKIHTI